MTINLKGTTIIIALITCMILGGPVVQAGAPPKAQTLVILIDLSDSPLHVTSQIFAHRAARMIRERYLEPLPLGSRILIRGFATPAQRNTILDLDYQVLNVKGKKPMEVYPRIEAIIAALPKIIKDKKLNMGEETWLLRTLTGLAYRVPKDSKTTFIALSDFLEYSADANAYQLVNRSKAKLPQPRAGLLKEVNIVAIGAGSGCKSLKHGQRLQAMWTRWVNTAGGNLVWIPEL